MNILQILLRRNIISKEEVAELQKEAETSGKKPEEVVLGRKLVDEDLLFGLKGESLKIPLRSVDAADISLKVLEIIPEDSAKYYQMVSLGKTKDQQEIGMVYPEDQKAQEALKFLARQGNFSYKVSLITFRSFEKVMKRYRNLKGEISEALSELEQEIEGKGKGSSKTANADNLERLVEDTPVTKVVAVILRNAVEGKASDIHIEPMTENVRVRFRSMGELHASLFLPLKVQQGIVARVKILAGMKIDETRKPQDGRFSTPIDGRKIDFRVATLPTALGEKIAIRVLDPTAGAQDFEKLGLEGKNLEKIKDAAKKPFGLILVTGPTGSGKTTSMYSILQILNKETANIISLEDPVEYFIPGINQSQMQPEIGYDFAQGLRQVLRQDPDVIMVGEVRDTETASLAIHAALTGHIVLSTLHTNNALGVVSRLVDMGVDRYLLPVTLSAMMSQRLVRKLCDDCKEPKEAPKAIVDMIREEIKQASPDIQKQAAPFLGQGQGITLYEPKGCRACGHNGFIGRIGVFEVLVMTRELEELILKPFTETQIEEEAKHQGMITMRQDGIIKALDGITIIEEVIRVTEQGI